MPGRPERATRQRAVIARLAFRGAPIEPEHAYYRVLNGFATSLDARSARDRRARPGRRGASSRCAQRSRLRLDPSRVDDVFDVAARASARCRDPGLHGAGVTVALLDTGVDLVHPVPPGRASARSRRARPGRRCERPPESDRPGPARAPRHRDGGARRRVGRPGRPAGRRSRRVAAADPRRRLAAGRVRRRVRLRPNRSAPRGIELAVDPNEDGDAHDAARVALVGVVEPFAAFTDGPLARCGCGRRLARLARRRRGRERRAGRALRTAASAAPAERLPRSPPVRSTRGGGAPPVTCCSSPGFRVLVSGNQPLGGVVAPGALGLRARRGAARAARAVVGAAGGLARLFDASGYSRVGGAAALLPRGTSSPEAVREVVAAGARAVLVDGPLPAGSLGTDGPADVPILGLSGERRRARARRAPARDSRHARGRRGRIRHERRARRRSAVLVGRARLRRRPEARGERRRRSASRPPIPVGTRTARRGTARSAARAQPPRSRRAPPRCSRRLGPISTPPG